jgi:molybdopterin converting factor small subunit
MQVEVRLYATLRRYLPGLKAGQPQRLTLPEGATVADMLAALGVPDGDNQHAFVNDIDVELDWVLYDGDRVGVFPQVGGGG